MTYNEELPCDISGRCVASASAESITNCIYCGKELVKRKGRWHTWDADLFLQKIEQAKESERVLNDTKT